MGLKVIRDRVQMLGGTMEINSSIGHGAHILFQIPATKAGAFAWLLGDQLRFYIDFFPRIAYNYAHFGLPLKNL
jgi:hypothetical protein